MHFRSWWTHYRCQGGLPIYEKRRERRVPQRPVSVRAWRSGRRGATMPAQAAQHGA